MIAFLSYHMNLLENLCGVKLIIPILVSIGSDAKVYDFVEGFDEWNFDPVQGKRIDLNFTFHYFSEHLLQISLG